jgi:prepilin-type N-terminal cleavage/methylation domain-containing protein
MGDVEMNQKLLGKEGFSLVEVLVASAVVTVILGALMSAVSAGSAQILTTKSVLDRQQVGLTIQGLLGNVDRCTKSIRQFRQLKDQVVVENPPSFPIPSGTDVAAIHDPVYYGIEAILLNEKTPLFQSGKRYGQELVANMRVAPMQTGRKLEAYDPGAPQVKRAFVRFTHVLTAQLCNPAIKGSCQSENRRAIPWDITFSSMNEVREDPYEPGTMRLYLVACGSNQSSDEELLGSAKLLPVQTSTRRWNKYDLGTERNAMQPYRNDSPLERVVSVSSYSGNGFKRCQVGIEVLVQGSWMSVAQQFINAESAVVCTVNAPIGPYQEYRVVNAMDPPASNEEENKLLSWVEFF